MNNIDEEFQAEMDLVREELAAWRNNPGSPNKIPVTVWDKATILAQRLSVQVVSKALRISYVDLKRRVTGVGGRPISPKLMAPTFVEIKPGSPVEEFGCIIELTKGSGTRLKINLKSAGSVDWCRIKEAFLGA